MPFPRVRISFIRPRHPTPLDFLRASSPSSSSHYAAPFSTTTPCRATSREPTLYEVLDVPITATTAEIKKQFYSLSLRHHPDRNRTDPQATNRFSRISSAYSVLSNAAKRATYDREHGIAAHLASTHSTAQPGQRPMGTHSSYSANLHNHGGGSYAGSRPASGLSKRRGAFRGPPPSFYAHGGYGNRKPPHGTASAGFAGAGGAGGTGKASRGDEDPTDFINRNPVNHFNARGHYRTQTAEDKRRNQRQTRARNAAIREHEMGSSADFAFRFIVVCGILVGAGALAGWPAASGKPGAGERRERSSAG